MFEGEQMKQLSYSSSGKILSLGKKCIGLFGGITLTGSLCEYAEDFITSEISFFTLCISLAFLSSLFVIVDARNMIIYMQKRKMKETIR
jgi:hypothetical protein